MRASISYELPPIIGDLRAERQALNEREQANSRPGDDRPDSSEHEIWHLEHMLPEQELPREDEMAIPQILVFLHDIGGLLWYLRLSLTQTVAPFVCLFACFFAKLSYVLLLRQDDSV